MHKAGRRFSGGPKFSPRPALQCLLASKNKICGKSLGAMQDAGFFQAMDCGRDPLCRDHFLSKLKIGCNPFTAKQVTQYFRSWVPQTSSPLGLNLSQSYLELIFLKIYKVN